MGARLRKGIAEDSGAVAVVVALLLVVFVLLAALAVDLGYAFNVRRQLQAAANAAALAGVQELGKTGDSGQAENLARDYAARNAVAPADGMSVSGVSIGSDYVQVTTAKPMTHFFSGGIAGAENAVVRATARARISYLVGMRGITPWFLAVMDPGEVDIAHSGSGDWTPLTGSGAEWSSGWSPSVAATATVTTSGGKQTRTVTGKPVALRVKNKYGVTKVLDPATVVVAQPADAPVASVSLSSNIMRSGAGYSVVVLTRSTATGVPSVSVAGSSLGAPSAAVPEGGGTRYTFNASAPAVGAQEAGSYVSVSVGEGANKAYTVNQAALLVVAQPNYVFESVSLEPAYFLGNSTSTLVTVRVLSPDSLLEGESYVLKQAADGSECGNFFAVEIGGTGGDVYRSNIAQGAPMVVSIGDVYYTKTGNMTGPTVQGLSERIGSDTYTYDSWVAAGRPSSPRLVYVPIMDWMQQPGGSTPVIVSGFAAFFVEDARSTGGDTAITGRFVASVAAGIPGTPPNPLDLSMRTARLVSESSAF